MISLQQTDSPVPLVVTVKLIGPMLAERTALMVLPTITWEQVARQQLQTVNGAEYARELLSAPLTLSLFRTAEAEHTVQPGRLSAMLLAAPSCWLRSRRLSYSHPLHRCVRRPTTGVDAFARIGQAGSKRALTVRERSIRAQTKDGDLSFQDRLCSSLRDGWMISLELLGVFG